MSVPLRLVVGITGGIAAYKAVGVVRAFVSDGHHVTVVATQAALNFVGRSTLEAISRSQVYVGLYDDVAEVRHVSLGQEADAVIIAPATANTLAEIAAGLAPDLLGNVVLARRGPLIVAPAMHTEMWFNPATVANIEVLRSRDVTIVGPDTGPLTGDDAGAGRMSEVSSIVAATYARLQHDVRDLSGVRVLVTGGGTREPIDPVRFLGNASSGRQAVAVAEAARSRGALVTFIAAHMDVDPPSGIDVIRVSTAEEMRAAVLERSASQDVVIMAAAVADYRAEQVTTEKIKKDMWGETPTLALRRNPDLVKEVARQPGLIVIGFAAETARSEADLLTAARQKAIDKGVAAIVANSVADGKAIGSTDNEVVVVAADGRELGRASGTKLSVAQSILDAVVHIRGH